MKRLALAVAAALLCLGPAGAREAHDLAPVLAATDWINGRETAAALAGKVTIVDVFTFDCINCKHVTPELLRLRARYPAERLAIVGVHAPETPEERERANVVRELARQGITWPVAIDNAFTIWHAYDNAYWPTQYVFDKHGVVRATFIGEGHDREIDARVAALLDER